MSQLINDVGLVDAINPKSPLSFKALWDTGATLTCLSPKVVQTLKLQPIGSVNMMSASNQSLENVYLVDLFLPNKVIVPKMRVTEAQSLGNGFDLLIGMDVIGLGNFAVSNHKNQTVFTFQIPSNGHISFVPLPPNLVNNQAPIQAPPNQQIPKVGRNSSCPCGSGKKYKKCHGKNQQN